jgi:CrcB protein
MMGFLLVGAGGALGAMARHGFTLLVPPPWGVMAVNVFGGFLMGLLVGWLTLQGKPTDGSRLFLGVGVLGGFTTFSAFSIDVVRLLEEGRLGQAGLYAAGSTLLSIGAVALGLWLVRAMAG